MSWGGLWADSAPSASVLGTLELWALWNLRNRHRATLRTHNTATAFAALQLQTTHRYPMRHFFTIGTDIALVATEA